jgi:DNA primase
MKDLWRSNPGRGGDVERVRDATDLVRLVGETVALRPKGREYVGLCPFHDDHTPSMYVVPAKQIFHCFVCGAGGDAFAYVQKFHKMEFREALRFLAERAGITLTERTPRGESEPGGVEASRADLLRACEFAAEFFRGILAHPEHGRIAREVVARRGIAPAVASQFLLGASPDRWDGLLRTLQAKGLDAGAFVAAGLVKNREESSGAYDVLRNRLIFPIQDQIGRVIAFGGRRLNDEEEPKYLNSPETRLFNKSATLYALHHAAKGIQSTRTAVITEGYTDVIACHQAGVTNAVATLGTALTREHARVLRRMCDRAVLLFDGDEAGQRAADRAVEVFFAEPLDVGIVTLSRYTDAKDPDELLKRPEGREVFARAVAGAVDLLEYRFGRLRSRLAGAGMAATAKAIEDEVAWLSEQGLREVHPVRQRLIVRRLAGLAGVDEGLILRVLPAGRRAAPAPTGRDAVTGEDELLILHGRPLATIDHLLGCVLCDGTLRGALPPEDASLLAPGGYRSRLLAGVAQVVEDLAGSGIKPDLASVLAAVEDAGVKQAAVSLASRIDMETDRDPERLRAFWTDCLRRARQDRAAGVASAGDVTEALRAIEIKRRMQTSHGADRRVLPRPT